MFFDGLVGELQPILGAVESSFKAIYRQPRSERAKAVKDQLAAIEARGRELEKGGVRLDEHAERTSEPAQPPAFDLEQLAHTLRDDLRIDLDQLPHPTTADPRHASRDAAGWRALATLGHPDLQQRIDNIAEEHPSESLQIVEAGVGAAAARADRSPPQLVERLEELMNLDAPVAVDDAADLATQAARAIDDRHHAALRRWDTQRLERERRQLLDELEWRVHRMLAVEALASGDAPAEQLWSALIGRRSPKLCAGLPKLLGQVGLSRTDVLSRYGPSRFEVGDADAQLLDEARAVKALWDRWRQAT